MTYIQIQNEVISKYRIEICENSSCWGRTHAHVRERRVCKWKQANSLSSLFELLHEVGHIETTKSFMRRAESEYYATVWALEQCELYGVTVPQKTIDKYQRYIDLEKARGRRRGGTGYGGLQLNAERV